MILSALWALAGMLTAISGGVEGGQNGYQMITCVLLAFIISELHEINRNIKGEKK